MLTIDGTTDTGDESEPCALAGKDLAETVGVVGGLFNTCANEVKASTPPGVLDWETEKGDTGAGKGDNIEGTMSEDSGLAGKGE